MAPRYKTFGLVKCLRLGSILLFLNATYFIFTSINFDVARLLESALFDDNLYYNDSALNVGQKGDETPTPDSQFISVDTKNSTSLSDDVVDVREVMREDATLRNSSSNNFTRYDDVVIVTKTLWGNDLEIIQQMLCYLSHAYNDKRRYDIVVFTTIPWTEEEIAALQEVVSPTNLSVILDGPSLEKHLSTMTTEEKEFLYKRCNVSEGETITWHNYCTEPNSHHLNNLGYCWQAEFRAYHIWTHPAIMKYKYMIWMDSDTRVATEWTDDNDPMKVMVENDLHLLFAGFPYGKTNDEVIKDKMERVYNKSICSIRKRPDGSLRPRWCKPGHYFELRQIAGNHHISNLETFRKPIHQEFLRQFVGDYRFSRKYDDQIAVTIPAVMEDDGTKTWHERTVGLKLKIAHHRMFDNNGREKSPANKWNFFHTIKHNFTGLEERCGKYVTHK